MSLQEGARLGQGWWILGSSKFLGIGKAETWSGDS